MEIIRRLDSRDIDVFMDHLARNLPEPGINGIITSSYAPGDKIDREAMKKRILGRWETSMRQGDWEVAWGIFHANQIVGHLELIGHFSRALHHRVRLGMGIESNYRSRGLGKELLGTAIQWAYDQLFLEWIDLDVFDHNVVAMKMYQSFGFQQVGKTVDRLRVNGQSIDDWHLVLKLRN